MMWSWQDCISYIISFIQFSLSDMRVVKNEQQTEKPTNPEVIRSLESYQNLKIQVYSHFINGQALKITNKRFLDAYNPPYTLMNNSNYVVVSDRKYENIQVTYLSIYRKDLESFAKKVLEQVRSGSALHADQFIAWLSRWVNSYSYFNHWVYKFFLIIERNSMRAQGCKLHFQGLKILKKEVLDPVFEQAYAAVTECLELFKLGTLREFEPLQLIIKYIGILGFTKFKLVQMVKLGSRYEYISRREGDQQPENPYDTPLFKKDFLTRLVKDLRDRYTQVAQSAMQLSVPEYFQKARCLVEIEEQTAATFYAHKAARDLVIRNVLEVLVVERAEALLKNSKSGFAKMMKDEDISNLAKIFKLLQKCNMERVFLREFQNYIQAEGEVILGKVNTEEERAMKKQTVISVLGEIINFNTEMERIRKEVGEGEAELQKAQNMGFQGFCNAGNRVCNYLAYYADLMLKKDDAGNHNSEQIIVHVSKISKYLYSYDYFVKMHQKLLGLRILYDNFKNQEAEQALITLLKNQAGLNATSKLSNMISDHKSSQAWNIEFQLKNKFGFGFDVMMLTSGSWEVNDPKCGRSLVPAQLLNAVEQFQSKFLQKMSNRSVSWIFTHGRAIVQLVNRTGAKFILVLNNYQLQVLLHIQNGGYGPVKYGDLLSALKIEDEPFFKNSVMNLLKYAVLVKNHNSVKIQSKSDELIYNHDFKYKTQKVPCIIIPKYTQKANNLTPQVNAERCILIDAALVKIMKQRRRAPFSQVLIQVQKMCKTFKAEISQIKLRIQNCQQRDFIQRDAEDMNILIYKP